MVTGKPRSRWSVAMTALLTVINLSGCPGKEDDQCKAFIDFLQNTAMRSDERLPTLTADQKRQLGLFVSDYTMIYGYSWQVNQAMDAGLRLVVDSVSTICVLQDYITQHESLRQTSDTLGVLSQQLQDAKIQADTVHSILEQAGNPKPVSDQVCAKAVTTPADALQSLISAMQIFTQQLVQVEGFVAQQGIQVNSAANGIQFPTLQQANQYSVLIGPLATQHQASNQAWTAAVSATR